MKAAARPLIIAWHFLTAVPVSRRDHDPTPEELAGSMAWYPLVGLLLGGALALSASLSSLAFVRSVQDALVIVVLVVLTRGLHQDGLADTLDGWAGGCTPEQRLVIMRDGRIGAIGATGLILALGLRYAGLEALPDQGRLPVLFGLPAVGRWAMVCGAVAAPYARTEGGLAEPFLRHLSARHVLVAALCLLGALTWALGLLTAIVGLLVAGLVACAVTTLSRRLCGGITGDTLGATNEAAEVAFLLVAPLLLRAG